MYNLDYHPKWKSYFQDLPEEIKLRVVKKIESISNTPKSQRHMRFGLPYFVSELGQYRITYKIIDLDNKIIFYFVGDHKEYEKWYSSILE
jgi:mRNA-degrading endonuclease RelE of RelBE toxin-antitoxin system